ncbi:SDR family oxidoreductase [Corynebacterium sp. MC-04]|uniref:SDR family oxidoreductase n=1 Tax=Corynebacterium parakroppenstedtii TaxID=2828363 RepID=A0ABS9HK18_9CORY|nr:MULTISPECIES: SDR family oxidoreductase [Corynebacterium]KXB49299.1 oxidoreductase, short chain dehydrogenase/reductase family protein [Corynebacterium kroppenstedtii]MBY0788733.1 SDR family oxidoreductase [Corynebacterium parakroppenstedtii]MBY0792795.1 SDR family oxidoreductase [Corynebacterium parakroppenstedtii]MBY0794257.1 SDR family oxidoreductase [Corynebacterium parakroppenstedtii]MBY0796896.1 SDR family oxidoreductase [Corynebacterium parakroppenstedtii]
MTTPPTTSSERPVALITGGTRGIGLAIAHDLATTHTVYIGGTSEESVKKAQETVPDARPFIADLTDPSSVGKALEAFPEPALDVLVLSAGISVGGTIADVSREDWVRVLDLNVIAQVDLIRQLLPKLRATHGDIVAINSGSGHRSRPGSAPYCASKFALRAITDALREEERGVVRVTSVHPGRVDTDMQREIQAEKGMAPEDYDGAIYVQPESIAAAVRTAIDATPECTVEEIRVRPVIA